MEKKIICKSHDNDESSENVDTKTILNPEDESLKLTRDFLVLFDAQHTWHLRKWSLALNDPFELIEQRKKTSNFWSFSKNQSKFHLYFEDYAAFYSTL